MSFLDRLRSHYAFLGNVSRHVRSSHDHTMEPATGIRREAAMHRAAALSLLLVLVAGTSYGQDATTSDREAADEPQEDGETEPVSDDQLDLDTVYVTGSRLGRTDVEGALPVTIIDRDAIDRSGFTQIDELLRSLSFNSGGSFRPVSGSSAQGVSALDLRAIGSSRTLVLVDGRRLPASPFIGDTQNLNVVPLGAIERIEVLQDGASAIYGSDAIGGVVNLITRDNYAGLDLMVGGADPKTPLEGGGDRREASITYGYTNARLNVTAGLTYTEREIIFAREDPWNIPGASLYGNSWTSITPEGFQLFNFSSFGDPRSCDIPGTGFYTTANAFGFNGVRCAYDFTLVSANEASVKNLAAYANASWELSENWGLYGSFMYSESESFGRFAPAPDTSHPIVGLGQPIPGDSINNPTNPDSPLFDPAFTAFGELQPVHWWHRFDALGPRDVYFTSELIEVLVGAEGTAGPVTIDFGARISRIEGRDDGYNFLFRPAAAELIASGDYYLGDPYSNTPEVLEQLRVNLFRNAEYDQPEIYASAAMDLLDLPAGPLQLIVGGEYREVSYADQYDPLTESGLVGGTAGNSASGDRDIASFYFESLLPLWENFELTFAGRYDDYSDFGGEFSPKVSLRWRPLDSLVIRASFGEGFRAPGINLLAQEPAFSADTVNDPDTCVFQGQPENCQVQINALVIANPELEAEQSDNISAGIVFEPADWFNVALDYYDITIDDLIRGFSSQEIVRRDRLGLFIPPGLGVERLPGPNAIIRVTRGFANEGKVETNGFDVNAFFDWSPGAGRMQNRILYSFVNEYSIDGSENLAGVGGLPRDRGSLSNVYQVGAFSFDWTIRYIGSQEGFNGRVPHWITHDVQAYWDTPWNGRIVLGARNVADKDPPLFVGDFGRQAYDFGLYNGYGRIPYLRYQQSFSF